MSEVVLNRRIIVTLNMPVSIPEFIIYVRGMILKLTGNPHFSLPYPALTSSLLTCEANVDILSKAQGVLQTRVSGSRAARDAAYDVCKKDMHSLRNMVQTHADNNVPDAIVIIESTGMGTRIGGGSVKKIFGAKNTDVSGTVKLFAPGNPRSRGSHHWFYTTDLEHFTNKIIVNPTTKANTTIEGLVSVTKYAFFHLAVVPKGINIEDGPIFLTIF